MDDQRWIRTGFVVSGLINVVGVLVFSKGFTSEVLSRYDPVVMSDFGLVGIMLWGLAYLAVSRSYARVPWVVGVFALEKLAYAAHWWLWFRKGAYPFAEIAQQDALAGIFFRIYGANDFLFMLFFGWVFLRLRSGKTRA